MSDRHRLLPTLALALGLALATASCGSDSDDGGGAAASEAGGGGGGEASDPGEAALEFAQCMRDEGVEDFPDPEISEDGGVRITGGGGNPDDPDVQAAQEACQPLLEQGGSFEQGDPERAAEMEARVLAFAECMREHGIDFPDPEVDGGRVMMRPGEGVDPESPEFTEAQQACEEETGMGEGPGGGQGGQP